jgi:FkbM family methyltransferase
MSTGGDVRLVVTLATIPSRIARIGPVIDSLKAQTRRPDRLYVCIPEVCLWERSGYDVPTWLHRDESVEVVVSATDYGPANKLIGVLKKEPDPSTRIVIVDDDWAYNPDLLETLESRFEEFGDAAIGSSGARLTRHWSRMTARIGPEIDLKPQLRNELVFLAESPRDVSVDILQYGFGAMVQRGWFEDDIRDLVKPLEPLFFADDVLLSGYLESKGIQRVCVKGLPLPHALAQGAFRPLHGDGRATSNYRAAIPELSRRLNIWAPETLFDPRPSVAVVARHLAGRALQKVRRLTGGSWRYRLALLKSQCMYQFVPGRLRSMRAFYGSMLTAGDLCFDLGSHVGNRVDALTSLSCRVVAVEPHPFLASYLRRRFAEHVDVTVVESAVSDEAGSATLHWSPQHLTVSSLEPGWVDALHAVRAHHIVFTESQTVETTTIGRLIDQYGLPRYCKLDIEGAEVAVIRSLQVPIDIVSFEHLPHRFDATAASLARLSELADYRYNFFVRESHRFVASTQLSADDLLRQLRRTADHGWSCDVFAFRRDVA